MNIVNSGARFRIFGEDVRTFKQLPVGSYSVSFNPMEGYSLVARPDLVVNEGKIYGAHERRINKVMQSFALTNRNFGIILSGRKGIGKSLFARMLARKAIDQGMPVITVGVNAPGMAGFLSSIEQECLIIFDEFEKVFGRESQEDGEAGNSSQEGLLSLFDGLDNGKKLFCITCNNPNELSSFFINRPGRFHYHFMLNTPTDQEVREYMNDKIDPKYADQIDQIVKFSQTTYVTYDYLRSIAFEINQGYTLSEALADLNISDTDRIYFDIIATMANGEVFKSLSRRIDLYAQNTSPDTYELNDANYDPHHRITVSFSVRDIVVRDGMLGVDPDKVEVAWEQHYYYDRLGDEDFRNPEKRKMVDKELPALRSLVIRKQDTSYLDKYVLTDSGVMA